LVVIKTKDLNNKLKQTTDLRREDKEKIKKKRRTLKNRQMTSSEAMQQDPDIKGMMKRKHSRKKSRKLRTKSGI